MAVSGETKPMFARLVRELPVGDYVYEPEWDGFRCLAAALRNIGVASSFAMRMRLELAREPAPLVRPIAGHPWERGFLAEGGPMGRLAGASGRWAPAMELDWVPLAPERVVEVS